MSKKEADRLKNISITFLKKNNFLDGLKSGVITWTRGGLDTEDDETISILSSNLNGTIYIRFLYKQIDDHTSTEKKFDYKIPLTTSSCTYGGKRYWFICPWQKNSVYCGKRVGILYKAGDYFACRHCYELTYKSRNVNRRYSDYSLFRTLEISSSIEKLEEKTKRSFYRNKPTKNYLKLQKLSKQYLASYRTFKVKEEKFRNKDL